MHLDPSESINNMGKLRVDILDGADLPSADRNGYSDPYCKFELNGVNVFKTKVQKKTLHPAWNEFFEVDIPSRTAADFQCKVYDWDFGDKADFLGGASINLDMLDPFQPQEYNLALDGKSGSVRLRLLFRPTYVTRSRQGSSTFSGTFAAPGKVVTSVAGAPIKGVGIVGGAVGHGVGKGVGFISRGFKSKKKDNNSDIAVDDSDEPIADGNGASLAPAATLTGSEENSRSNADSPSPPQTSMLASLSSSTAHLRHRSFGAASTHSTSITGGSGPVGTATFQILSAQGYPPKESVLVYIKQLTPKAKVLHKTKHIKSSTGTVNFDDQFTTKCTAEQQFQLQVKAHSTFGSDDDLGEALFFVDDSGSGGEKAIKAGNGTVVLRTSFTPDPDQGGLAAPGMVINGYGNGAANTSPKSMRRSFLAKREHGGSRVVSAQSTRDGTPTPGN